MRAFFKKKNKSPTVTHVKSIESSDSGAGFQSTTPVDPEGASTASNASSNEIYLSNSNANHTSSSSNGALSAAPKSDEFDVSADASSANPVLTTSQFKTNSDEKMERKYMSQPQDSPAASTNAPSRQGKNCDTKSREGVPIITSAGSDFFSPSAVSSKANYKDVFYSKSKKTFGGKERPKVRPSAKNSAFGGAPRYDWMDIETTAAIKIQANFRRLQIQNRLDELNLSTPGMRNRRAQRQARYQSRHIASADAPFPFNLCGVGLLFGDGTFEDEKVVDSLERKRADRKKKAYEREDEEKRKFRMRKKDSQHLEEGIEVVESFDDGEEEEEEERMRGGKKRPSRRGLSLGNLGKSKSLSPGRRRVINPRSKNKRLDRAHTDFDGEDL